MKNRKNVLVPAIWAHERAKVKLGVLASAALFIAVAATADRAYATATFTGAAADGVWTNPANWVNGNIPGAGGTGATFRQRINIGQTTLQAGVTTTYSGENSPINIGSTTAAEARAFVISTGTNATSGTLLNFTSGTWAASGTSGPTSSSAIGLNGNGTTMVHISGGLIDLTPTTTAAGRNLTLGLNNAGSPATTTRTYLTVSGTGTVRVDSLRFNDISGSSNLGVVSGSLSISNGGVIEANDIQEGPSADATTRASRIFSTVTFDGGTLKTRTTTNFVTVDNIIVGAGGATFQATGALTLNAPISGAGGLSKTGAGNFTLSNSTTHAGPTTIAGNGSFFYVASGTTHTSNFVLDTGVRLSSATLSGVPYGEFTTSGNLILNGSNILNFSLSTPGFLSVGAINATGSINVAASGVASGTTVVLQAATGLGAIPISSYTLTNVAGSRGGSLAYNDVVTPTQLLFIPASGNLTWRGANPTNPTFWSTNTNTTAGNVQLGGVDDFFQIGDNVAFDDTALTTTVAVQANLSAGNLTFANSASTYTFSGANVTAANVSQTGASRTILTNNFAVSGATTISSGVLQLGNGSGTNTFTSGSLAFSAPGALELNYGAGNASFTFNTVTGTGSILKQGSGRVSLFAPSVPSTVAITVNEGTLQLSATTPSLNSAVIGGSGNLEKNLASVLTLDGTDGTLTGTTRVINGVLRLASSTALAATSSITVTTVNTVAGTGTASLALANGVTIDRPLNITGTGVTAAIAGTEILAAQRGALQASSGSNTYSGPITVNSDTPGAVGSTRIGVQDGAALTITGPITEGTPNTRVAFRSGAAGYITLTNPSNAWTGGTSIFGRGFTWGVDNAIPTVGQVLIGTSGIGTDTVADLNGFNQSVFSLGVNGNTIFGNYTVTNTGSVDSTLTISDGNTDVWSGSLVDGPTHKISLIKSGPGTQTFSGNLLHTGGTTITGGQITIGEGGTNGAIGGNVLNDAKLAFNRSDNTSYAGVISGTGSLEKFGAGALILNNVHTFTGETRISDGTLQLGDGGTAGSVAGNIVNNRTLALLRSDNVTLGNAISGTGSLNKLGANTVTLSGALSYTGNSIVSGGELIVQTPLRPVIGSLVVTGSGATASLAAPATLTSALGYTIAGEFTHITATASGTVSVPVIDRVSNKASVLVTSSLSIDTGGTVDLGTSDLIIRGGATTPAALDAVRALVSSGSLKSSVASSGLAPYSTLAVFANEAGDGVTPYFTTYDGVTDIGSTSLSVSDVIVKYTYVGDVNLDGLLNGLDLARILEGYSTGQSGWGWGDVDNSGGVVSDTDVLAALAAISYYQANPGLLVNLGDGAGSAGNGGAVPEPASLGLLLSAIPLAKRRRRTAPSGF